VVASEVRALAGRSATAAKEIKTLINASVERVEIGTTLVDRAGATMKDVVASIEQVTAIVEEISIASSQQDSGVAQIGAAVMSLDQVIQQNAALVEEMSAAAGGMKSQAQELVETCAVFTLESGDTVRSLKAPTQPAKARTTSPFKLPAFKPSLPRLASAGGPEGGWESF
jgi:methyl-accepting chemotaxis protein